MKPIHFLAVFSLTLFLSVSCFAQSPELFEQNNSNEGLTLNGQKLTVAGDGNTLVILGSSPALIITGSNNTISIQAVDEIEIAGSNNQVTWSAGASRDLPQVQDNGQGNQVKSGEVNPNQE